MEIKKVYLENIRSYEKAELEFPAGSVLLSGDIGSGKSSILLAIEFALFGLQKGALSGSSLLRNGADNGKVVVNFEIDNNDVIIERNLKRSNRGVSQETGSISINEEKKEVAPKEMRSTVLNLLNYPQEFVEKRPELYRYTVYTPQEEMKQILVENVETRLNTLRRVFAIDKYKRIQENTNLFLVRLRESIRNKEGMIADLDTKKNMLLQKEEEKGKIEKTLKEILPSLEKADILLEEKRGEMKNAENKLKEIETLKRSLAVIITSINSKSKQISTNEEHIKELEKEIESLVGKSTLGIKRLASKASETIEQKKDTIKKINAEFVEMGKKKSSIETKIESLEKIKKNLLSLDTCPTCHQKVEEIYKKDFIMKNDSELKLLNDDLKNVTLKTAEITKMSSKEERELRLLQEKEKELAKADASFSELEREKKDIEKLNAEIRIEKERYESMKSKFEETKGMEEKFEEIKKNVNDALERQKEIEIKKARISEQLQSINFSIKEASGEIEKKEKIKSTIEQSNKIKNWLGEQFVPLVGFIEKNVMSKLHHEFNILFEKWFNMLVASEGLKARLDENFTPIIEQQGYDIDYEFLSGGERTAAALAYRLSLNQVINGLLSHIKTRDLLILDEPTDGFSSEQLDKMKYVFDEISAKQIILVSHESKIENFVDSIIRFEKSGHVSRIS